MAFSTGVSLLTINPNTITLRTGLLGYWDFENTLLSYTGTFPYIFNGVVDSGTNDPSKDINYVTTNPKVGSYNGRTLSYNTTTPNGYYASIKPSVGLNRPKGTFCGWVKVAGPMPSSQSYTIMFPLIDATGNSADNLGDMGVSFSGTSIGSTSVNLRFANSFASNSTVDTINPASNYVFICYWYDFTDTTMGANGSQYLQVNNGAVRSLVLPNPQPSAVTGLKLKAAPSMAYSPSSSNYTFGSDVDAVGIWDRVLTNTERSTLYNGGSGCSYSQLP